MTSLNDYAKRSHGNAVDHGFWPSEGRNFGEMLALVHSELSEALEEHRSSKPKVYFKCKECGAETLQPQAQHYVHKSGFLGWLFNKLGDAHKMVLCPGTISKPEGSSVELIDAIIRLVDIAENDLEDTDYSVEDVMDIKMAYNETRPYKHGREY